MFENNQQSLEKSRKTSSSERRRESQKLNPFLCEMQSFRQVGVYEQIFEAILSKIL